MQTKEEIKIEVAKSLFISWAGNTDNYEKFQKLADRAEHAAEVFAVALCGVEGR